MSEQLRSGMKRLDNLAYSFASKMRLELEEMIFDDGVILIDRDTHTLAIHCGGSKASVNISTEEIANFSISAQHKLVMALMKFVPLQP